MRYDPHRYFVAPALASAEAWRTAAGTVLTLVAGLALYQLAFAIVSNLIGPDATRTLVDRTSFDRSSAFATLYSLFTFGFFAIGLAMVVSGLHRRSPATLFGPAAAVVSDGIRVALAAGLVFVLVALFLPSEIEPLRNETLSRRSWILLLPVSLLAILVQAGTEELFFRGYLQQQVAARFPGAPFWMILPSLLFGLAHLSPEAAGENAPLFMLWAVAYGLAAADLTARTGAIGAALGFHVANNVSAVLVVSLAGPGSGLALYHLPLSMDDPALAGLMVPEFLTLLCGWLAARLTLKV